MRDWVKKIYYFFPVNLLVLHFKKNQILLGFWFFFFLAVSGKVGSSFGLHYLFLDPEYLHKVDFWSMLIVGLSLGLFTLSFFITCYILDGHKYKFLGLTRYPFIIFSLNNGVIPLIFFIYYSLKVISFQASAGMQGKGQIFLDITGLFLGYFFIISVVFFYFSRTNRSALNDLIISIDEGLRRRRANSRRALRKIISSRKSTFKIRSYFKSPIKIERVNKNIRLNSLAITKVFDQNHLNAIFVEVVIFIVFMSLGFYRDFETFRIPAGASTFLFFSFMMMLVGALFYWLRGWAISVVIIGLISIDSLMQVEIIKSHYEAFGIDYENKTTTYTKEKISQLNSMSLRDRDKETTLKTLKNWRAKFGQENPKLVLIASSGGGQRSTLWTTNVLQHLDKKLDKRLMDHTTLITGASGGIVGSSYYRELYLRDKRNELNLLDEVHLENISKDILNPMIFSLFVSDLLLRYQTFEEGGKTYYKGRGYAFEQTLNQNINGILSGTLNDYKQLEADATIPMVLITPTIINDGRKLFISTQKVSYMNSSFSEKDYFSRDRGVDFLETFKANDPEKLRFLSALRMSATFPYVTPNVQLPSTPRMEVMDAGLADNFGISDGLKYLHVFQDWIEKNTSGVVMISIRDKEKNPEIKSLQHNSFTSKLSNPISGLYNNWDLIQDYNNDHIFEVLKSQFSVDIDQVTFEYKPIKNLGKPASLSWHLTTGEKASIKNNIYTTDNQRAVTKITQLLKQR